jgi:hypothetical protein
MNKTLLKGTPIRKEGKAAGAIIPGQLIDFNATGDLVVHATAAGVTAAPYFAAEQDYFGKDIDTACAIGDQIGYNVSPVGTEIYAFLDAGENATKGAFLESAGNGSLQVRTTGKVVARALEAVNNTAGGAAVRIIVEVL